MLAFLRKLFQPRCATCGHPIAASDSRCAECDAHELAQDAVHATPELSHYGRDRLRGF
jgi:hypothetical protein